MAQAKASATKNSRKNSKKAASTRSASARRGPSGKKTEDKSLNITDPMYSNGRYIAGVLFLVLSICIFVSYGMHEGSFVIYISNLLKGLIGWGYYAAGACFFFIFTILCFGKSRNIVTRAICIFLLPLLFAACIGVITFEPSTAKFDFSYETDLLFRTGQNLSSCGVISGLLVMALGNLLTKYGAGAVLIILLFICVFKALGANAASLAAMTRTEYAPEPSYEAATAQRRRTAYIPEIETVPASGRNPGAANVTPVRTPAKPVPTPTPRRAFVADIPLWDEDEPLPAGAEGSGKLYSPAPENRRTKKGKPSAKMPEPAPSATDNVRPVSIKDAAAIAGITLDEEPVQPALSKPKAKPRVTEKIKREDVEKEVKEVEKAVSSAQNAPCGTQDYEYPTADLLNPGTSAGADSRDEILANKARLESALRSFGVNSPVVEITRGPTVTRFDIELEQGVKLSRITNLAEDIALSLGVVNVRIAPIPDKISTVGIEVPNKIISTVSLRDIIDTDSFRTAKSKLSFAIGKDISGKPIIGNISKLPHMLIAGTTGSGKSVCMNSLILSLLYKARPDEVKFIMIDPKMVELGVYNSIPHLYVPVVTDPKKAAGALQWAVVEMLKRYRLFSEAAVRDLATYNSQCTAAGESTLPQVVIVIDELADLMMAASKEVEESICRIAQMGRAAGMHLVIATQRPSADVITGLMKANIPSRIAFAVSSALESRIILDQAGAEKLIGMGDMLYSPVGIGKPVRIQGAFVSDEERENVIDFIKERSGAEPREDIEELRQYMDKAAEGKNGASSDSKSTPQEDSDASGSYDALIGEAAEVVIEMKQCSVSMLQRRLKLGYSRAARVVDQLEELGVVGPYEGAKPRSVLVDRSGWNDVAVSMGLKSADGFAEAAEISEMSEEADS